MEKNYVLAIDQSTQGTKAILFDKLGNLVCRTDLAHKQLINEKGWVSHDLSEIYQNTIQVVKNLVEKAGIRKEEIACLGISNQRETSAAWNKETGEPLAHAIVWQCSRAEEICERIKQNVILEANREHGRNGGVAEIIRQKTGIHLSAYFPAAKYAWLQEHVEAVKKAKQQEKQGETLGMRPRFQNKKDAFGNTTGGIRLAAVDYPVGIYQSYSRKEDGSIDAAFGTVFPFSKEMLTSLYGTLEHYRSLVRRQAKETVALGFLRKEDLEAYVEDTVALAAKRGLK